MSTPAKRKRQPRMGIEVRREQILDAALQLLNRHGYAALTMEAVSREVDLAKPRVYAAYPGLEPLLIALLERERQRALVTLAEAMPAFEAAARFDDVLVTAMMNLLNSVVANPESWQLLLLPAGDAPDLVRDVYQAGRGYALTQLRDLLAWAQTQGHGVSDLDLELSAQSLMAIGEQAARMVLSDPSHYPPERYEQFARHLLARIAPQRRSGHGLARREQKVSSGSALRLRQDGDMVESASTSRHPDARSVRSVERGVALGGDDPDVRFPDHDYPSDVEIWLENHEVVMIRHGMSFIELSRGEARDLGAALIELADAE